MNKNSPYFNTPVVDFYLDIYVDRPIPADSSDVLIQIEERYRHRPDLLSFDLYGTTDYWWIFMRRNLDRIEDPIYSLVPPLQIFVPTLERLRSLLD